jgi:trehalose/maltose transport system substrate-binding protein
VLVENAVARPSTVTGARYDEVSRAYYTAVREALLGHVSPARAVADLERTIRRLLAKP